MTKLTKEAKIALELIDENVEYGAIAAVFEETCNNPHWETDRKGSRIGYNAGWFRDKLRDIITGNMGQRVYAAKFLGSVIQGLAYAIYENKYDPDFIRQEADKTQAVWEGKVQ